MDESFLHFLWMAKLYDPESLITDDQRAIEVINPGISNPDAGPDFLNARIRIDEMIWAGNVEVHIRASDWLAHGHFSDPLYDNVILHVVVENDQPVFLSGGDPLPAMILRYDKKLEDNYEALIKNRGWIACQSRLHRFDPFRIRLYLGQLVIERLERFTRDIEDEMQRTQNNWEEVVYRLLAKGFGLRVNAQPFLLLARSIPLAYISRHRDNLHMLEAMFFGQAGWLNNEMFGDTYFQSLKTSYRFLQQKFSLQPLPSHIWRFMRLRPSGFPTVRLAQFIQLIYRHDHFYASVLEAKDVGMLRDIFSVTVDGYWQTHYLFNKPARKQVKSFGEQAFQTLLINIVLPLFFIYGKRTGADHFREKALDMLEQLPAEKNQIIRKWAESGIRADNAFYSQGLIQLKNEYCNPLRCADCQIGQKLIINL